MVARALGAITGGLEQVADEVGVSYNTLWSWKEGRRNPSPENLRKLAEVLERRGGHLRELAGELREAAGE